MATDDATEKRVRKEDPERSNDFLEETAGEVASLQPDAEENAPTETVDPEQIEDSEGIEGRGLGIFGLTLSLLSLLFLPVLLGAAGIIVGFIARRRGANTIGNWAIGVGAVSIVVTLFLAPFF